MSAYPLALWLASNWWRLRWEPTVAPLSSDWRMSHEMPAAGFGYLWPALRFESDGENVLITCTPSPDTSTEPVRFLSHFSVAIPGRAFEHAIERFINTVIARLGSLQTDLQSLWDFVNRERADKNTARERRLEAQLGFDAGESPAGLLSEFHALEESIGTAAMEEVAPICAGDNPIRKLREIEALAGSQGILAQPQVPKLEQMPASTPPWERGWVAARRWRSDLRWNGAPVDDSALADLLSIGQLLDHQTVIASPLGLAVRESQGNSRLHFRKRHRLGRRFEAARFLAEHALAPNTDSWLPITDARTARQKAQRAFASEFLCPAESLNAFLAGDFTDDNIEAAADYFQVSEIVVRRQLINHHLLPPGTAGEELTFTSLP